jgi:hypothetical protein
LYPAGRFCSEAHCEVTSEEAGFGSQGRPLVLALTVLAALSCLYIAGEEICWGQVIFGWQEPELVSATNREGEFSLHNEFGMLERLPRALLEIGVVVGGLIIPAWCTLAPRWRASRIALFLPSAILVPTAAGQSGRSSISRLRTASCMMFLRGRARSSSLTCSSSCLVFSSCLSGAFKSSKRRSRRRRNRGCVAVGSFARQSRRDDESLAT